MLAPTARRRSADAAPGAPPVEKHSLYGHRFSSYTQKVLIALYENDTPFGFHGLGPDQPQNSAEWLRRWPLRKFPLLVDGERRYRPLFPLGAPDRD